MPGPNVKWPLPPPSPRSQGATLFQDGVPLSTDYGPQGAPGAHNWPTQPPHNVPIDLPARLSRGRTRAALLRYVDPTTGAIDWLALFDELLAHIDHRVFFNTQVLLVGVANQVIRPEENRRYLFIQNTDGANNLFVGFGFEPSAINCVLIGPGGFYEPLWVPQNDIQMLGSAAGTNGTLIYANA